jgi:thiazole synthase ThiGH ThiG subunit
MDKLIIAGKEFNSRLLVGTGKFASCEIMAEALQKSGTEIVTVALRRVNIENKDDDISTSRNTCCFQTPPAPAPPTRRSGLPDWRGPPLESTG